MRLYGVNKENNFAEYQVQRFKDEHLEETIEAWLEQNPESILENGGLLMIGRQVTTNLNTSIDLLGLDREGNVAVVELKRDRTPRETLAQALEYASFTATLNGDQLEEIYRGYTDDENASLVEVHRKFFSLGETEAISFNKNQRIVIVSSETTQAVRQSAAYLRQKGLLVTCLDFSYFQSRSGERLLSMDTVVGREPINTGDVVTASLPKTTEVKFLAACDEIGRAIFEPLLVMARQEKLPIHWGSRGFSINLDLNGNHVGLFYGYPKPAKPSQQYQSLWTGFNDIAKKIEGAAELIDRFKQECLATGLFVPAGPREIKYIFQDKLSPEKVQEIVGLVRLLSQEARVLARKDGDNNQ